MRIVRIFGLAFEGKDPMAKVFLLLGSNLGNRQKMLEGAIDHIQAMIGPVHGESPVYETEPWGFKEQPLFLNQVIQVETGLAPEALLDRILAIESRLGRARNAVSHQARLIDIDILFYDQLVHQSERLVIPHPHLHLRSFVLVPLHELAPDFVHPLFQETVQELFRKNQDPLLVRQFSRPVVPIAQSNDI